MNPASKVFSARGSSIRSEQVGDALEHKADLEQRKRSKAPTLEFRGGLPIVVGSASILPMFSAESSAQYVNIIFMTFWFMDVMSTWVRRLG